MRLILAMWMCSAAWGAQVWVGFRYDASHVLIFTEEKRDTAGITLAEAEKRQLAAPLAQWGRGGYLLPLSEKLPVLAIGDVVNLALGGNARLPVRVEGYVEQWGNSQPMVLQGVMLRVGSGDMGKFKAANADYFVAYSGVNPLPEVDGDPADNFGKRSILNRFGTLGDLVLMSGEKGWSVTLWRTVSGISTATKVRYSYGD